MVRINKQSQRVLILPPSAITQAYDLGHCLGSTHSGRRTVRGRPLPDDVATSISLMLMFSIHQVSTASTAQLITFYVNVFHDNYFD